jgi:hypothetical protein
VTPPPFPADVRADVRRVLLGTPASPARVALTPLPTLFEPLRSGSALGGWWPAVEHPAGLAVLVPQGSAMLDAVCCLEPGTEIVFGGLAGSFGELEPGALVEARAGLLDGGLVERSSKRPLRFAPVVAARASCLAESDSVMRSHAGAADCVDMETALLYAAAAAQDKPATALLIISDVLPGLPFFAADPKTWHVRVPDLAAALLEALGAESG